MTEDEYRAWLAAGNGGNGNATQSMGAAPTNELMTAPTGVPDYHNSVGDSQSGYVAPPSTGSKILSGLAGLSKVGNSPSAPIPAPALTGPSAAPTSLTPAYSPLSGAAPQPIDENIANAGVSSVPNFVPAPGVADHAESLLGRIAQFAKKAGSNFATNVSGLTDAQMATMSPADIHRAKIAGFQGFANRLANPSVDAQGFRQSNLQALGSAIPAGTQAAQQYVSVAQQASQNLAARNMAATAAQNRAAIGNLLAPADGEDVAGPQRLAKLIRAQGIAASTPGMEKDAQSIAETIHWTREQQAGAVAPNLVPMDRKVGVSAQFPSGYATEWHDPKSGKVMSTTPADAPAPKEAKDTTDPYKDDRLIGSVTQTFDRETKDFRQAEGGYQTILGAMSGGRIMTAQALNEGLNKLLNPGSVVRKSTMELMNQAGSFSDRIRKYGEKAESGTVPADIAADYLATARSIMQQRLATATAARKRAVQRLTRGGLDPRDAESMIDDLNVEGLDPAPAAKPVVASPAPAATPTGTKKPVDVNQFFSTPKGAH